MFNSDVTKNYNHQDATLEILIMLLGALLLGALLCWLLRKLYATNELNNDTQVQSLSSEANTSASISTPVKPIQKPVLKSANTDYSTPRIDDLTKIIGIDSNMQNELKGHGIRSYTDLRDIDRVILKDTLISRKKDKPTRKEVETWPHQASLAAKGEWKKLSEYQAFIQRANVAANKAVRSKPKKTDDLKKIEGIGPKIEEILNNKGLYTYKDIRKTESDKLKNLIVGADQRFKNHDTESWPHQAGMAEKGQWEELNIYQEFMDISNDSNENQAPQNSNVILSDTDLKNNKDISSINEDYHELLKDDYKLSSNTKTKSDDLKKIDGIGPKIEALLNKNSIYSYKDLHKTDLNTIKGFLDKAGPQYQVHEPNTWPHQAGMADRGEWDQLKVYQDIMIDEGADDNASKPSSYSTSKAKSKPVSLHIKKATTDIDDLKKIEGIGPKIELLLKEAGINTFKDLMQSERDQLKKLLDAAGPQYRMHEPETWPTQAKMAFSEDWDKLEEYQDFLLGGRE